MEDAVEPGTVLLVLFPGDDDQADLHAESPQDAMGQAAARLFLRRVENDREIEIAVGAVFAAGARSEENDPDRIGRLDNAAHGFGHLLVGDRPPRLIRLDRHAAPRPLLAVLYFTHPICRRQVAGAVSEI